MYTVASPAVVVPLATWTRTLDLSTMCGAVVVVVDVGRVVGADDDGVVDRSIKKAAATKKEHTKSTRVQITDENGNIVSGRDNTFKCVECGNEITGPWSYKMHLVKQHDYSRKQAGLREEK